MNIANKNYLGIALAGLAIILFWIFVMPIWDRISLLNTAITEREDMFSSREEILRKINDLNNQYQERAADISKISSVVPNTKNVAEMVSTIEAVSRQTGIRLVEISMGESNNPQQELQTISIGLGLIGSYPSFTTFLDLVERNLRLIDVKEISVSQISVSGSQTTLNFRVKADAYFIK